MKRITVAVEMTDSFIRMLNATVQMEGMAKKPQLTAADQLALTLLYEARGATEDQVDATITNDWADDLRVLHDARVVAEDA